VRRILTLCLLAVVAFAVFGRATCKKAEPAGIKPVEAMKIKDNVYYHNVGITYGDSRYYTLNGGNEDWGLVNVYDEDGDFVDSWDVEVDGRAIFYDSEYELLYIKPYGTDYYTIDPELGDLGLDVEEFFIEDNSSIGWTPDGEEIYELSEDGEVTVYESYIGMDLDEFELTSYSETHGYQFSVAASDKYLFAWDGPGEESEEEDGGQPTVWVYTLDGEYVDMFRLPRAGFPFSLSWANDMLWIAEDANATEEDEDGNIISQDGWWYGYRLEGLE
jgi:hypothetical protein